MNISQLRTFLAVIEHGSFSDAAKALGISQPAVTMQIQSLEGDLGVTLLDRRYRRIDLTEAGRLLVPHARKTVAEVQSARDAIEQLSGEVGGRLEIAASTTPGVYVVPRLLGAFDARYPKVDVSVSVHDTAEVVERVEDGRAQLGVSGAIVRNAKATFDRIADDELVLISPPDSPLASRPGLTADDLAHAEWIVRESGSGTRSTTERALASAGIDLTALNAVVQLGTGEAIVSAVEGGLGIAMVSRMVADKALRLGSVIQLHPRGLKVVRPFFAVMPKGTPTRAASAFAAFLHDALEGGEVGVAPAPGTGARVGA
ncbi:MAG: LysR family transcriptional regulator [Coriobacteriia bacterium]|nr:LysR family transcriptional regulator [Coriobacteriia bacterium]